MIDWGDHYTVDWRIVSVNPDTWDDSEIVGNAVSASVNRDCNDDVPLLETASIVFDVDDPDDIEPGWYRIVMYVEQNGIRERRAISTEYFQYTSDVADYGTYRVTMNGSSVLYPASRQAMADGSYVPKGVNGPQWVHDQLAKCVKAPIYIADGGFTLDQFIVYESSWSVLKACWQVLDAGKWILQVNGDGEIYIMPKDDEPDLVLNRASAKLLAPEISHDFSLSGVPNRYIAQDGERIEVAENHDPTSPISYENLGWWQDPSSGVDTNPAYVDGESLWTYVRRRLEEESTITRSFSYTREYYDDVYPFSLIRGALSSVGLDADMRVMSQTLSLDQGITVNETSVEERKMYRMYNE